MFSITPFGVNQVQIKINFLKPSCYIFSILQPIFYTEFVKYTYFVNTYINVNIILDT